MFLKKIKCLYFFRKCSYLLNNSKPESFICNFHSNGSFKFIYKQEKKLFISIVSINSKLLPIYGYLVWFVPIVGKKTPKSHNLDG